MNQSINILPSQEGKIYTLVESGTQKYTTEVSKLTVSGEGTEIQGNTSLINRAKRKTISRAMVLSLIDVVKEKGEPERQQAYWNAYYCQSNVVVSGNRLYGNYCKNRFCTVCCAIRKAEIINRYYPEMIKWEDVHFVTLTVKACKAKDLNLWVYRMFKAFELIKNRCKKRHQRGKGIKLVGIKSLECNFNPLTKTYNPHFHIIVPSKGIADLLKKEWLEQWRPTPKSTYRYKYTSPQAQYIRPVKDLERDLIEVIKYGSKIFTEPDLKKKGKQTIPPMIYAYALDNIFVAMKGTRIFDRFGFNLPEQEAKVSQRKLIVDYEEFEFLASTSDWINPNTGECLTGYIQPKDLEYMLNDCINTQLN